MEKERLSDGVLNPTTVTNGLARLPLGSVTASATPTATATASASPTVTATATATANPTATASSSPTPTATATPTTNGTITVTATATGSSNATATATATVTFTVSNPEGPVNPSKQCPTYGTLKRGSSPLFEESNILEPRNKKITLNPSFGCSVGGSPFTPVNPGNSSAKPPNYLFRSIPKPIETPMPTLPLFNSFSSLASSTQTTPTPPSFFPWAYSGPNPSSSTSPTLEITLNGDDEQTTIPPISNGDHDQMTTLTISNGGATIPASSESKTGDTPSEENREG